MTGEEREKLRAQAALYVSEGEAYSKKVLALLEEWDILWEHAMEGMEYGNGYSRSDAEVVLKEELEGGS